MKLQLILMKFKGQILPFLYVEKYEKTLVKKIDLC